MEKGFSMPDVQVGSIIEYYWQWHYEGASPPEWYIQQTAFVHRAHYLYRHSRYAVDNIAILPQGAKITGQPYVGADLTLEGIPALADEEDSPPRSSLGYRVLFFYEHGNPDTWWQLEGMEWGKLVDKFCAPEKLRGVVEEIVAAGDTDEQKLQKIYAATMTLENTNFTRERTQSENKVEKLKVRTAADIWKARRGDDDEIALLFIALARAAGLKAYAMMVTDRDRDVFIKARQDWGQLNDIIAVVNLAGREKYFDPGERYCEFGKLHWKHAWTYGVRQVDGGGAEIGQTPFPMYTETETVRNGEFRLDADTGVHGTIRVSMTGSAALRWRQEALLTDEREARKEFGAEMQKEMPAGVTVTMSGFTGLSDPTTALTAALDVSGTFGSMTGKRMLLPGTFFEAQARPRFVSATRENPVYLPYSYAAQDHFRMTLPSNATVEILPKDADIPMKPDADYVTKYRSGANIYQYVRLERVATILYETKAYPALRDFYQKTNTQDQAQVVLKLTVPAAQTGGSGDKN
jgi:transglutaminase-like putative cysteine protease